jgi:hypothetical protein
MGVIASERHDSSPGSGPRLLSPGSVAELDDPGPHFSPENLVREIAAYPYETFEPGGARVYLTDLPLRSEGLTLNQARAIFESFKERISRNLTSGRSSSHFEQYVLYALGQQTPLAAVQKNLVLWLCIAMRKHALPGLWSAQFVFENIDNPKVLRRVLAANLWSQLNYHKRLAEAFNDWQHLITPPNKQIRLMAVGYSDSIVSMLTRIAEAADHSIIVYIPDLAELGREQTADEFYRERLSAVRKVKMQAIASDRVGELVSTHKIDIVFLSSKVISATACKTTRIVESAACLRIIRNVCASSKKSRWGTPALLVAGAIFKIWPARLYTSYFNEANTTLDEIKPTDDAILTGDKVTAIVTDVGSISPHDLRRLPNIAYRLHTDNFATASALHLYQADSGHPVNLQSDPVRHEVAGGYSFIGRDNEFPLMTERDCIILQTVGHDNAAQNGGPPTGKIFGRQDGTDVEQAIDQARDLFKELLADDDWYQKHKGKYIAISAHPTKYITAPDLDSLRRQPGYDQLGIWYRCRVDRNPAGRTIADSPRTRLLSGK